METQDVENGCSDTKGKVMNYEMTIQDTYLLLCKNRAASGKLLYESSAQYSVLTQRGGIGGWAWRET